MPEYKFKSYQRGFGVLGSRSNAGGGGPVADAAPHGGGGWIGIAVLLQDPARRPCRARGKAGHHPADGGSGRRAAGFPLCPNGTARGPRVLNTAIAYLNPFFYADPLGIYFESSLTEARFDPATVPPRPAARFYETLRARHVLPRKSRYAQPEPVTAFPSNT